MWVWPQLVFGGFPPSPVAIGGPFPQAKALPSPPSPSLPPPPLALFAMLQDGAAQSGVGGGVLGCKGGGGEGPPAVLGARPTSVGTRQRTPSVLEIVRRLNLFGGSQKGGFQKGGFGGCSPGTKTGTRVRSPKPPFCETALLSPSDL